jgi:hypothetical protein
MEVHPETKKQPQLNRSHAWADHRSRSANDALAFSSTVADSQTSEWETAGR